MKTRIGFVSNSSSASFVISTRHDKEFVFARLYQDYFQYGGVDVPDDIFGHFYQKNIERLENYKTTIENTYKEHQAKKKKDRSSFMSYFYEDGRKYYHENLAVLIDLKRRYAKKNKTKRETEEFMRKYFHYHNVQIFARANGDLTFEDYMIMFNDTTDINEHLKRIMAIFGVYEIEYATNFNPEGHNV